VFISHNTAVSSLDQNISRIKNITNSIQTAAKAVYQLKYRNWKAREYSRHQHPSHRTSKKNAGLTTITIALYSKLSFPGII
jgi:hypothetical protein